MGDITWSDVPGSELPTRVDSIDFSAPRRITEVRAVYDEEYAYRTVDGVGSFQAGFTGSTISGDGKTVALRRSGGWNRKVRVYPEVQPVPPATGGQAMGAVYEVDFTSLANQTIGAAGAYTIDGKTWWAKGALTGQPFGSSQDTAIVNGSGLRFRELGSAGVPMNGGAIDYPYRILFFPLSQLADYNPLAPLLIRWYGTTTGGTGNVANIACGLTSSVSDGANHLAANRQYDFFALVGNQTTADSPVYKRGTGNLETSSSYGGANGELAVSRYCGELCNGLRAPAGSWTGSFPDSSYLNADGLAGNTLKPTRPNPGVLVAMTGQVTSSPCYLRRLRIEQPRVP